MDYILTITGAVHFRDDGRDDHILHLLQGKEPESAITLQREVALQEMEEQAVDVKVTIKEVS